MEIKTQGKMVGVQGPLLEVRLAEDFKWTYRVGLVRLSLDNYPELSLIELDRYLDDPTHEPLEYEIDVPIYRILDAISSEEGLTYKTDYEFEVQITYEDALAMLAGYKEVNNDVDVMIERIDNNVERITKYLKEVYENMVADKNIRPARMEEWMDQWLEKFETLATDACRESVVSAVDGK